MRALKTEDIAGNIYYVECDNFLTNSTVNVRTYVKDRYHELGTKQRFFRDFNHLNKWLAEHPEQEMFGKPTFSTGNKIGNSRDNHVYSFED